MLALRRLVPATRSLHTTATGRSQLSQTRLRSPLTSVYKKGKAAALEEEADLDDDLFDDSVSELPSGGGDRAQRRADLIARIMNPSHSREEHRAGNLRKVVQLSDTPEQLEEVGRVIQQWRVNGYQVSKQTSTEIVGRCINLGRADLAEKYYKNRADCECARVAPSERSERGAERSWWRY